MKIQVLGSGCSKCKRTTSIVKDAVKGEEDVSVETVYDLEQASRLGMMQAPGLIIEDDLVLQGRVPSLNEVQTLVEERRP